MPPSEPSEARKRAMVRFDKMLAPPLPLRTPALEAVQEQQLRRLVEQLGDDPIAFYRSAAEQLREAVAQTKSRGICRMQLSRYQWVKLAIFLWIARTMRRLNLV